MSLAPIGISTYIRLRHLERTVNSLRKNIFAKDSELYIFSDAPKIGDEAAVKQIRDYIHSINGFKKIHIVERKTNGRVKNNRQGHQLLLEEYGRGIFLEEDIVTAPGFLKFMNNALDYYKDDPKVFSITGYAPPIGVSKYCDSDVFILPRFNAWGFGIWKYRYDKIAYINADDFEAFKSDKNAVAAFKNGGGEDMMLMLQLDVEGEIDALDVKAMYWQFLSNQYTVYPRRSLTLNIGIDGTGVHCGKTDKFDVDLWDKSNFSFKKDLQLNSKILKANRRFRSLGVKYRLKRFLKFIGIYELIKKASGK